MIESLKNYKNQSLLDLKNNFNALKTIRENVTVVRDSDTEAVTIYMKDCPKHSEEEKVLASIYVARLLDLADVKKMRQAIKGPVLCEKCKMTHEVSSSKICPV